MLRWLRDRRKHKKSPKARGYSDDYGFHPGPDHAEDKTCHIYEEIPDLPLRAADVCELEQTTHPGDRTLPDPESCLDKSFLSVDRSSVFSDDTLRKYIIGSQGGDSKNSKQDGPYMVVPLLNCSSSEKPELPPPNKKRSEFTCALVGCRNSELSRSAESGVEVADDYPASQASDSQFSEDKPVDCAADPSQGTPVTKCSGVHATKQQAVDASDTCYEFDVSTSSESDNANYEYYLSKIEQNLAHKCKIRAIIEQCVPEEDLSDCESLTTVSSLSCCSSVRPAGHCSSGHRSTDQDSDEGTLADHSESENSSGYYESFSAGKGIESVLPRARFGCAEKEQQEKCEKEHCHKHSKPHKKRTVAKKCRHRSVDAPVLYTPSRDSRQSAFRKVNRSQRCLGLSKDVRVSNQSISRLYRLSGHSTHTPAQPDLYEPVGGITTHDDDYNSRQTTTLATSRDYEDREVYSPPPSVSDFSSRTSCAPAKATKPWLIDSADVYRSRTSNNRLLSELIIMNYDKQLFIH